MRPIPTDQLHAAVTIANTTEYLDDAVRLLEGLDLGPWARLVQAHRDALTEVVDLLTPTD